MVAQIRDRLLELSLACAVSPLEPCQGWTCDVWELTESDLRLLRTLYGELLAPRSARNIFEHLSKAGVPVDKIFRGAARNPDQLAKVRRADMIELAAAASMIAIEGSPIDSLVMPNVPKSAVSKSESGLDVLAVSLAGDGSDSQIAPGEMLYIGSAKHSLDNPGSLRYQLSKSVSQGELSDIYLFQQLRVLHGRLKDQGRDVDRVFLFLEPSAYLSPSCFKVVAIGAVDVQLRAELEKELQNLDPVNDQARHVRLVLVPSIKELQKEGWDAI